MLQENRGKNAPRRNYERGVIEDFAYRRRRPTSSLWWTNCSRVLTSRAMPFCYIDKPLEGHNIIQAIAG